MIKVSIIAAIGENRELGKDNDLLWHIPEDLAYFKDVTRGAPVIMGRMTYLSLPEKFRPLPGRPHVVLMHEDRKFEDRDHPEVRVAHMVDDALLYAREIAQAQGSDEIFVLGGASIYTQMLESVDRLYITEVQESFPDADVFFPEYRQIFTHEISRDAQSNDDVAFDFVVLER